jgi:hypothetical protein
MERCQSLHLYSTICAFILSIDRRGEKGYVKVRAVVSSGFRGLPSIVFGVITNDDQVKDDHATQGIGKGANFIGFGAKLTEEAFQEVS